jgi:hypothetical protein
MTPGKLEQVPAWPELAEFRCPPCSVDEHWNHRQKDGSCRSIDRIHDEECRCSWRDTG